MPEAGQVNGHQMGVLGQAAPDLVERIKAFRPRTEQERVLVPIFALGEADRQPVDRPELRCDRRAQPGAH
jgi:hypothetical protein